MQMGETRSCFQVSKTDTVNPHADGGNIKVGGVFYPARSIPMQMGETNSFYERHFLC